MRRTVPLVLLAVSLAACRTAPVVEEALPPGPGAETEAAGGPSQADLIEVPDPTLSRLARDYVALVLAVGRHDPAYVDAYYGPPEWREAAEAGAPIPLDTLLGRARELHAAVAEATPSRDTDRSRQRFLMGQLESLEARVAMLNGRGFSFDEASEALYGAVAPSHDLEAEFGPLLARLEEVVPGEGPLADRYHAFRERFIVPPDRVEGVFRAAIDACRERTVRHATLPEGEHFTLELVEDKPWGGYNWYQGHYDSLIEINVSLPTLIDRAVDIACHEGYPGHHVYNSLLEWHLVRERGWVEFMVYPLFSPQSLIAEGSANFGIEVAFPGHARQDFEREVLYPLAGLDPASADRWAEVRRLTARLTFAGNEIARRYLDGAVGADEASALLERWLLMSPADARQRLRFVDTYGAYVINYNLGKAMVRDYVEAQGGTDDQPERRWEVFLDLLASPRLPADLRPDGRVGVSD